MTSERSRARLIGAITVVSAALVVAPSSGRGDSTPREALEKAAASAPAMQGHDAEARMRDPDAEVRWRRLFFEPAGREEGEAQVSCDHRIARRPDLDGGPSAVVVLWNRESGRVLVRRWESTDGAAIDLAGAMRRLAEGAAAVVAVDGLAFRRSR